MPRTPVKLVRKRLDAAGVAAYVRDLAATATQIEARAKDETVRMSDATAEPLDALVRRLVAGELAALQIRFFVDGEWWIDTVLRGPDAFRLVRMREGD